MKRKSKNEKTDELRPEYDLASLLKGGVRGKYAKRYQQGTTLVLLSQGATANDGKRGGVMRTLTTRATIYLDPEIHRALRLKAIETSQSLSKLVNDAVRVFLAKDAEHIDALKERRRRSRLSVECAKLDQKFEKAMAEEGITEDMSQ